MSKDNILSYRKSNFLYIVYLKCKDFAVFFTKLKAFFCHDIFAQVGVAQ